jgi:hypothetical protein
MNNRIFIWSKLNTIWIQLSKPCGFYNTTVFTQKEAYDFIRQELIVYPGHSYMIRKVSWQFIKTWYYIGTMNLRPDLLPFTEELRETFLGLAADLSPENISCDGELSNHQINQRRKMIMFQWKAAEAKAGRKVTENEIWSW